MFLKNKFMLGDNFSMLDVAIAPLLWRLDYYGIDLQERRTVAQVRRTHLRARPISRRSRPRKRSCASKRSKRATLNPRTHERNWNPPPSSHLIRALHEWCTDIGFTPHGGAGDDSVQVPREYERR